MASESSRMMTRHSEPPTIGVSLVWLALPGLDGVRFDRVGLGETEVGLEWMLTRPGLGGTGLDWTGRAQHICSGVMNEMILLSFLLHPRLRQQAPPYILLQFMPLGIAGGTFAHSHFPAQRHRPY